MGVAASLLIMIVEQEKSTSESLILRLDSIWKCALGRIVTRQILLYWDPYGWGMGTLETEQAGMDWKNSGR